MPITPSEIDDALTERRLQAERVKDWFNGRQERYADWKDRIQTIDEVYAGNWTVVWPDYIRSDGLPKIPNLVQIASEDRARQAAAGTPSIVCRPERMSDAAKTGSERRERILGGYWEMNRVRQRIVTWAHDIMAAGLCACKVLPDTSKPMDSRFPIYTRMDPRFSYPSPVFAQGPYLDDFIYAYEVPVRILAEQYPDADLKPWLAKQRSAANPDKVRLIEFYDRTQFAIICTPVRANTYSTPQGYLELVEPTEHKLNYCPVVIGVRPTMDNVYRGDFDGVLAVLNTWNRLMNLHLDAAADAVYPERLVYDIENEEDFGPDAVIHGQSREARVEYIAKPGANFSNHQMLALQAQFAAMGSLMPPSRSGDPNESIISAAGISAANSQQADHVRSIQRDAIAPMLEAANSVALCADERWGDTEKEVYGTQGGRAYRERYKPSRDIAGNYRNSVVYGMGAGLDEINTNVMVLQQMGQGLISKQTAREQSPFVDDPLEEDRRQLLEVLTDAMKAGLIAKAANGELNPVQLAAIAKDIEGSKPLREAIADNLIIAAPLATPPGAQPVPSSPGMAGAGSSPQQMGGMGGQQMPPMNQVVAGRR